MVLIIEVSAEGDRRPPAGAPIRVEARDTSLADAPARTIAAVTGAVRGQLGSWLDTVELEFDLPSPPAHCTIWAHVDTDQNSRVSRGDFVTTASYPVPAEGEARVAVTVRPV